MSGYAISGIAWSALIIAGLAAAPAVGQTAGQTAGRQPTVVVSATNYDVIARRIDYRDLDLASADGERRLVRRVRSAVHHVCLDAVGSHRGYMTQTATCQRSSWQTTQPQVGQAVQRAREVAANGWSAIAPVAIAISVR